ncbi:multiubiquitin domain-containing protein [uncultured Xanthomonas sp.]|uniref:multiubiquitin domain-containing protein n=1 Tax=uncultured Xanthomonas sp. TaxID=152831 RepID=UPI0025D57580|nr:multiubiquitin domain-containing protein [uncultured Xanthomonas sp.]
MNQPDLIDCDDVGEAIREGRALRPARVFRIRFAQDDLNFRVIEVPDPIPLGRQILSSAGLDAQRDYSLFAILDGGDFEDVRLDETFDLRGQGAERFVAFQTDREFKLMVNGDQVQWGKPAISGAVLYGLATPSEEEAVFLVVNGGTDREIARTELFDLTSPGVERFITAPRGPRTYRIIVNGREIEVAQKRQTFDDLVALAYPGTAPAPNVVYSITYSRAASTPHSGELGQGGFIEVKNGTRANVTCTVQS